MNAIKLWQLILLCAVGANCSPAVADMTFYWHPNSPFGVGRCIDLRDLSVKQDAFEQATEVPVERGIRSVKVYARQVESMEQFAKERHLDLSIAGSAKFKLFSFGGGSTTNMFKNTDTSDNSIQFVFKAEQDFGRWKLSEYRLNEPAQALVNNPNEFTKQFGNYYVVQSRRAASVIAHVVVSNVSRETKRVLRLK